MPPPLHKFKPALLVENSNKNANGDTKEVFFTGSHGDVGGEWSLPGDLGTMNQMTLCELLTVHWNG